MLVMMMMIMMMIQYLKNYVTRDTSSIWLCYVENVVKYTANAKTETLKATFVDGI